MLKLNGLVAVLPMRLNVLGTPGLMMLVRSDLEPFAAAPQPGIVYHVTSLGDSQSGVCTAPSGSPLLANCSTIRAAVIAANANPGLDAIVFDVNGAITLTVPGDDDEAAVGDLDVTDALAIIGNGVPNTIIQGGTSASSGIDKVFSFNPYGIQPGFAVSLSGLTVQFGKNPITELGNNDGRIYQNTSVQGAPAVGGDAASGVTLTASNNWWGSNSSPASLVAPGIVTYSPWLVLTFAVSPTSIYAQGTSILTARIATGNDGSTGYQIADGTPVSVAGTPGSVSPASSTTSSGAAVSTYTAGTAAGTASVSATLDSQTLTASINVTLAPVPTLTTIAPASGVQGATAPVTLTGTNFVSGATVAVNNPGIAVSAVNVVSATQITVTFTIAR